MTTTMIRASHYIGGDYAEFIMVPRPVLFIWPGSVDVQMARQNNLALALTMRWIKDRGPHPIGEWYRRNYERDPNFDFGD